MCDCEAARKAALGSCPGQTPTRHRTAPAQASGAPARVQMPRSDRATYTCDIFLCVWVATCARAAPEAVKRAARLPESN